MWGTATTPDALAEFDEEFDKVATEGRIAHSWEFETRPVTRTRGTGGTGVFGTAGGSHPVGGVFGGGMLRTPSKATYFAAQPGVPQMFGAYWAGPAVAAAKPLTPGGFGAAGPADPAGDWTACSDDLQLVLEKTFLHPAGVHSPFVECTDTARTTYIVNHALGPHTYKYTVTSAEEGTQKNLASGQIRRLRRVDRATQWVPTADNLCVYVPPPAPPTAIAHRNAEQLKSGTEEHAYATEQLVKTAKDDSIRVLQVERLVAASELALVYKAKAAGMESRGLNEQWLWHGTEEDSAAKILRNGFNRSLCGKNGTVYGEGVYFSVSADYALRYAKPDALGRKHIFLCSVLVGRYTQGHSRLKAPPALPGSADGTELYDSVVDNVDQPGMVVIFNDTQVLPQYLLTVMENQ